MDSGQKSALAKSKSGQKSVLAKSKSGQKSALAKSKSCFVKEIKPFLLHALGSIHEVIYVLTDVAIAIFDHIPV